MSPESEYEEAVIRLNREVGELKTELFYHRLLLIAILGSIVGQYFV